MLHLYSRLNKPWLYESFIELSPNTHDHSQSNHIFFLSTLTHILSQPFLLLLPAILACQPNSNPHYSTLSHLFHILQHTNGKAFASYTQKNTVKNKEKEKK